MLKSYLKIAIRNITRNRVYAAINVTGLAIGIAASLLLFVVVRYELSYNTFHAKASRIFRVVSKDKYADGITYNGGVPVPMTDALRQDYPEATFAAMNSNLGCQVTIPETGTTKENVATKEAPNDGFNKKFIENTGVFFIEPQFFTIFDSKWLAGTPGVLASPDNVVLDKSSAIKYFGSWTEAVGRTLIMDNRLTLKVAGVIEDYPANSDFPLKVIIPFLTLKQHAKEYQFHADWNTLGSNHQVFVLLPENQSVQSVNTRLASGFIKKYYPDRALSISQQSHFLQPLKDLHFDNRFENFGDHVTGKTTLWTLSLIGVLAILMASINFINLATAQSASRSKEVGIRKVLGSNRPQLIFQVMGETFLIVLSSVLLAVLLSKMALPYLKHIASVPETIPLLNGSSILFLSLVTALVTLFSGLYPALILSGFKPVLALKSRIASATLGGISMRRVLVITQFTISQFLIVGTVVAVSQMNFVQNADLGFNKEAVLVMPGPSDSVSLQKMKFFKEQLLQNPDVKAVTLTADEPSSDNNWSTNFYFNHSEKDIPFNAYLKFGDADYFKTFGIRFLAGQSYPPGDTARGIVINETMAKKLGIKDPQQAIGKEMRLLIPYWQRIVGVVKDFKTNSLREEVKPLVITANLKYSSRTAIKVNTAHFSGTIASVRQLWETNFPDYVRNDYFIDDHIAEFYNQENQLALIYKIFAGLAIFISCLGLYGLVSFMAMQKTREVGIRKVLGASAGSIVYLFSREFTLLIAAAFLLATPVAWYLMNNWLNNFAYRIHLGAGVFLIALFSSVLIAWLTVGYKAIRAALANPVKSLRAE